MYSRSVGDQSFDWVSGRRNSSCLPEPCWRQLHRQNEGPTPMATDCKRPNRCQSATGWRRLNTIPRRHRHWRWCSCCRCWWCRRQTRTSTRKSCRNRHRHQYHLQSYGRCWCYWCCYCWCYCYGTGIGRSACSSSPVVCGPIPRRIWARRYQHVPATPAAVCSTDARRWRPPWWVTVAMAPTFFVPDCPTIRPMTAVTYRSSDTSWPAANPCPSSSGPSVVDCRTRNYHFCSSTSHCCCGGAHARHRHKSDLSCNSVNMKHYRIRPVYSTIILEWQVFIWFWGLYLLDK